ncbi:MAG: sulfurtransferase [Polyangiales bacterium]
MPRSPARPAATRGPLVDVAWLRAHLTDPAVRVIDLRWYLADKTGADEYARGHIPGAVFVDLHHALTGPVGPGRHPIPSPAQFERAMRAAGVSPETRVVVYDDAGGSVAARLWWLLQGHGHTKVHVLDGGFPAWVAAGGEVETAACTVSPGRFVASLSVQLPVVDRHLVEAVRTRPGWVLLDARAAARFRGEVEPIDARPGHIPGARSAPWTDNLVDGHFADAKALRARFRRLGVVPGATVICYCGSGVTACHDILALALARISATRVKLYEGSWSDWSRDPDRPAALGDATDPPPGRARSAPSSRGRSLILPTGAPRARGGRS